MSNFALATTGDIDITGGRMSLATGQAEVRQRVETTLRTFYGEVSWDTTIGVDWRALMATKRTQFDDVREEIRAVIEADPGIIEVQRLEVAFDPDTRALSVDFTARTIDTETGTTNDVTPSASPASAGFSLATLMSRIALRFGP